MKRNMDRLDEIATPIINETAMSNDSATPRTDLTLEWDKPMSSAQAAKFHLTRGFVAIELYNQLERSLRAYEQAAGEVPVEPDVVKDIRVKPSTTYDDDDLIDYINALRTIAVAAIARGKELENKLFLANEDMQQWNEHSIEWQQRAESAERSNAELRESERKLSDAYVRLRVILKALDTPTAPTPEFIYAHTEAKANELRERLAGAEKDAGRYRWLRAGGDGRWTVSTVYKMERPSFAEENLDRELDAAIAAGGE